MIFKQVFDQKSSTYTYIIASSLGREALIIDPVLENVEDYLKILRNLELKLVKVIDTHIHADHITGASKLKDKTKCVTIMGNHAPTDAVEIKVEDSGHLEEVKHFLESSELVSLKSNIEDQKYGKAFDAFLSFNQIIIVIIFHSQDLLSRDVLLMFPSLRRYHHNLRFCNMGVPWDVP